MFQGDLPFVLVTQVRMLREKAARSLIHSLDEAFVYGNTYQGRGKALGDRCQVVYRVTVEIYTFPLVLVAVIVPGIAAEIRFKDEFAVFDDQDGMDILVGIVLDESDGLVDLGPVYPDLVQAGRLPAIVRLLRYAVGLPWRLLAQKGVSLQA